jgi:predicted metal-dependent peptidase
MRLRASYPPDVKKGTLVHELLHRMLSRVKPTSEIDEHRKLFLVLYDIWVVLHGKDFADQNVAVESRRKGLYDYESAWKWALRMSAEERAAKFKALRARPAKADFARGTDGERLPEPQSEITWPSRHAR